jgi:hypothetical protein
LRTRATGTSCASCYPTAPFGSAYWTPDGFLSSPGPLALLHLWCILAKCARCL